MHKIFVVFLICTGRFALAIKNLPCLTDEAQKDLEDARTELTTLDNNLETTVEMLADEFQKTLNIMKNQLANEFQKTLNNMKNQLGEMKTNISEIVRKVDTELIAMKKGFEENKWKKYEGHCYYFSHVSYDWFTAELNCRQNGGYIVKIDSASENSWIAQNRPSRASYWIGLTDLKEGDWRWSFDQSRPTYKATWVSGYGSKGTSYNCVVISGGQTKWHDYQCWFSLPYICESNYC